ncbi:MAG: hypothetical protein LOD85_07455, partial [Clostridia bacterium]
MSAVYRVHPHPGSSSLLELIKNADVDVSGYQSLSQLVVTHVDVDPADRSWEIYLEGACGADRETVLEALRRLEAELARAAEVEKVRLIAD